ncbi:hypothetical protein OBBRIDRAFT_496407 [Obba rivulosa]|uniref:Uncharacterized protein n=1 Tax=Obba rivulosa TaxID=1052685 RepID=A0A8E2J7V3_9APHY|nr:hypothetical protein OBBRIDRAFT_496407 [Obba rivulosa]
MNTSTTHRLPTLVLVLSDLSSDPWPPVLRYAICFRTTRFRIHRSGCETHLSNFRIRMSRFLTSILRYLIYTWVGPLCLKSWLGIHSTPTMRYSVATCRAYQRLYHPNIHRSYIAPGYMSVS